MHHILQIGDIIWKMSPDFCDFICTMGVGAWNDVHVCLPDNARASADDTSKATLTHVCIFPLEVTTKSCDLQTDISVYNVRNK